jgi:Tfp pilus assembly protein PilV
MACPADGHHGERKVMKRLAFVTIGIGALALAACNKNNQDAVQNAEINQPQADQLNELANQAAEDAANAQAAANNAAAAANEANAVADNTVNPKEADEQNVSGM